MEMLIVVAILGVMAALATPRLMRMYSRMQLKTAALSIKRQMQTAQGLTIRSKDLRYGIYYNLSTTPNTSQTFIDNYPVGNPNSRFDPSGDATLNDRISLPTGARFFIPGSGGIADSVVLFRGNRSAKKFGTLGLTNSRNDTMRVNVLASTGRIRVQ